MKKLLILFLLISANQMFAETVVVTARFRDYPTVGDIKKQICNNCNNKIYFKEPVNPNKIIEDKTLVKDLQDLLVWDFSQNKNVPQKFLDLNIPSDDANR